MIEILSKLFGSSVRVKVLRLFLANKGESFNMSEISGRTKSQKQTLRKELNMLTKIKLLKSSGTAKNKKWSVNKGFTNLKALENFILDSNESVENSIAKKVSCAGDVKMIVTTGIFTSSPEGGEIDLLIVANKTNDNKIKKIITDIESELGKELRFALLSVSDFDYRLDIGDRLIRNIFDYEHNVLVDKLN